MRVLVRAALPTLGDLAKAIQVKLALEAGEFVLLEEPAKHFGAQTSVVADLHDVLGRKIWFRGSSK